MTRYPNVPPVPHTDSRPFWESCGEHAMRLQQCNTCGRFRYPPRGRCPNCLSQEARWTQIAGTGHVYVSLTVSQPLQPSWAGFVPFNLSIIQLDEGVRLWSNVVECEPEAVEIGDRVRLVYEDVSETVALPRFVKEGGV